jgi:hypothetical protein
MPENTPNHFTRRETALAVVRELVNVLVNAPENRSILMNAVSDYGREAAFQAIDGTIKAINKPVGTIPVLSDAAILDEAQARR